MPIRRTDQPVREGIVALLEPFIDTVVICTMTSLVLVITGVWTTSPEEIKGAALTAMAFDQVIPGFGKFFVPVAVGLFAYSTLISWSYYGERCTDFLFGPKGIIPYKVIFCIVAVIGSVWELGAVVAFSDIMLALMVIPNLIAVAFLAKKVKGAVNEYFAKLKAGEFDIPEKS